MALGESAPRLYPRARIPGALCPDADGAGSGGEVADWLTIVAAAYAIAGLLCLLNRR